MLVFRMQQAGYLVPLRRFLTWRSSLYMKNMVVYSRNNNPGYMPPPSPPGGCNLTLPFPTPRGL